MPVGSLGWEDPLEEGMATPSPLFLPGESHGQRSLAGYSPWGQKEQDMAEHMHPLYNFSSRVKSSLIVCQQSLLTLVHYRRLYPASEFSFSLFHSWELKHVCKPHRHGGACNPKQMQAETHRACSRPSRSELMVVLSILCVAQKPPKPAG